MFADVVTGVTALIRRGDGRLFQLGGEVEWGVAGVGGGLVCA